jgi:hypothetical protein
MKKQEKVRDMHKFKLVTCCLTAALYLLTTNAHAEESTDDTAAIQFVSFFDQDYIIMYGSSTKTLEVSDEKRSIETLFSDFPDVNYVRTPTDIQVSTLLPLAIEHGTWRGGQTTETTYGGRYTAAWRKVEDEWKIHNELFVTLTCEGSDCPQQP